VLTAAVQVCCSMTVPVQIQLPACAQFNSPRRGAAPPSPATKPIVFNKTPRASKLRTVDGVIISAEHHLAGTSGVICR
jgi:hypothetical protein